MADFVIEFPVDVTEMTVHQLAEKCNVASSAVVRFCKAIQLQGFSELKLALARELGSMKEAKENAVPSVIRESGADDGRPSVQESKRE